MPMSTAKIAAFASSSIIAASMYAADTSLGLSRDIRGYRNGQAFLKRHSQFLQQHGDRKAHLYQLLELARPDDDALWFEGRSWSYRALKRQADEAAASLYHQCGVRDGDIVTIFMTNCPEMVVMIYAITRLGAVPALVNNALRDDTLVHCIRIPQSKVVVCSPDIATFAVSAGKSLEQGFQVVSVNLGTFPIVNAVDDDILDLYMDLASYPPLPSTPRKTIADAGFLIYTSGTTGKPKACSLKNLMISIVGCPNIRDTSNPKKYLSPLRIYSCMPLFHGTTLFAGLITALGNSGCFCLGRKFSARGFFKEVHHSNATRILYVGELLRFLLATPPGPYDQDHKAIVATGNGLQKDVWDKFQRRFNIPEIREFYRSSEGLVTFENVNMVGKPGAGKVGFSGALRRKYFSPDQCIVKFNYDTQAPERDPKTGFCIIAKRDEPGEAIGRIKSLDTYTNYHNDPEATEKKMLRDVFQKGDLWQRSGDLLVEESDNWVKFVDRIGDTYRWMGENVSAGEIAGFISQLPGVVDVIIVGRRLERYDGQAGTALVVLEPGKQSSAETAFIQSLCGSLLRKGVPRYALPRLVTISYRLSDVGHTFKHSTASTKNINWGDLSVKEGDGRKYYLDTEASTYKPLDRDVWAGIEAGKVKL